MDKQTKPLQEWKKRIVELLTKLSEIKSDCKNISNSEYASIGTSDESKELIKELCDDIDVEYKYRRELSEVEVEDSDKWLKDKAEAALDELHKEGCLLDSPTGVEYENLHEGIVESLVNSLNEHAEVVADELDKVPQKQAI